ncbi:MAG TPA: DUF190 domain-containing protein [Moorella mulderi]|nr:DUF190 domain-containing protein [Moorella mulderi]
MKHLKLKIYTREGEKWEGVPLYHALLVKFQEAGLAGATVYKGVEGYGPHGGLRTSKIPKFSIDLPVVIEVVEAEDKIREVLPLVRAMVKKGLIILQEVEVLELDTPEASAGEK